MEKEEVSSEKAKPDDVSDYKGSATELFGSSSPVTIIEYKCRPSQEIEQVHERFDELSQSSSSRSSMSSFSLSRRQPYMRSWGTLIKKLFGPTYSKSTLTTEEGIKRREGMAQEKCFMLSARELSITWGDNPENWTWVSHPDSRFKEVALLLQVWWLDVKGKLKMSKLSPNTTYVAYFIFKLIEGWEGLDCPEQEAWVTTTNQHSAKNVCLERGETSGITGRPQTHGTGNSNSRAFINNRDLIHIPSTTTEETNYDGWVEVAMGEFFNGVGTKGEVVARLLETKRLNKKSGLLVGGIEFRPKTN